jgi:hypothetical protein
MKNTVFFKVTPCSLAEMYKHFAALYNFPFQCLKMKALGYFKTSVAVY